MYIKRVDDCFVETSPVADILRPSSQLPTTLLTHLTSSPLNEDQRCQDRCERQPDALTYNGVIRSSVWRLWPTVSSSVATSVGEHTVTFAAASQRLRQARRVAHTIP